MACSAGIGALLSLFISLCINVFWSFAMDMEHKTQTLKLQTLLVRIMDSEPFLQRLPNRSSRLPQHPSAFEPPPKKQRRRKKSTLKPNNPKP